MAKDKELDPLIEFDNLSIQRPILDKVLICISGYTSETDDPNCSWYNLLDVFYDVPIFSYKWPSKMLGLGMLNPDHFNSAKRNAKKSGQVLAYLLIVGFPFFGKKIELLGFSLGCQVIKSCL